MSAPLLLIDGDNLAHRAYHSVPKTIRGAAGQPVNAIVGFTNMLVGLWEAEQPRAVFVAWDTLGVPTYRNELWPAYQAGRVFDHEIRVQLNVLPDICRAFGFGVGKGDGAEADDYLASAARKEAAAGGTCVVFTNDRDAYQLVSPAIQVLSPRKGISDLVRIGEHEVVERFGVLPAQVPDWKALAGDPSDNIPGARGIGPKSAAAMLLRHGNLERVLEREDGRLGEQAEQLLMFREMVRLRDTLEVELPESCSPNWVAGAEALSAAGAETLSQRIAQRAHSQATLL